MHRNVLVLDLGWEMGHIIVGEVEQIINECKNGRKIRMVSKPEATQIEDMIKPNIILDFDLFVHFSHVSNILVLYFFMIFSAYFLSHFDFLCMLHQETKIAIYLQLGLICSGKYHRLTNIIDLMV